MKYSALISSQNMMFNDENYKNGGRPYFAFGEIAGFRIVPFISTHVKKKKKNSANQNLPICMKTTDIKLLDHNFYIYGFKNNLA